MMARKSPGNIWKRMAEKESRSMAAVSTVMRKSSEVRVKALVETGH